MLPILPNWSVSYASFQCLLVFLFVCLFICWVPSRSKRLLIISALFIAMLHPSQMEFYSCETKSTTSPYNISRLFPTSNLISITVHCQSFPATENVSISKRSSLFLSTSTTWAWWIILEFFFRFSSKISSEIEKVPQFWKCHNNTGQVNGKHAELPWVIVVRCNCTKAAIVKVSQCSSALLMCTCIGFSRYSKAIVKVTQLSSDWNEWRLRGTLWLA